MSYQSVVLADSPQGFWDMGSSSATDLGSGSVNDVGTPQNLSYVGSPSTGASILPGDSGLCLVLNGTSQGARVGATGGVTYALGDTFSWECWFTTTNLTTSEALHSASGNATSDPACAISDDSAGHLEIEAWGHASIGIVAGAIGSGSLYHYVWTKSGATSHVYLNNSDVTPTITNYTFTNPVPGGGDTFWGIGANGAQWWWAGKIQYPAIYSTALTSTQVGNHYTAGTTASSGLSRLLLGGMFRTLKRSRGQRFWMPEMPRIWTPQLRTA